MAYKIKLTSKGQLTLPKEIREMLTLKMGDYLLAQVDEGRIILKPVEKKYDRTIISEYAIIEGKEAIGLGRVRETVGKLDLDTAELIRKTRDEEAGYE